MDRMRDACPTGMMLEVHSELSPYPPLEPKSMERGRHELIDVPADGDCLYHSLAALYNFTVEWPNGAPLRDRMQAAAARYSAGTPFPSTATARFLRMLFLDFLREHWDHYYGSSAFRDALRQVAEQEMASSQNGFAPTSMGVKKAYIRRMRHVGPRGRVEWGGPVECDIASELFGMRITLWVDLASEPRYYWRNNVFQPELHADSANRGVVGWEWNLVQTEMAHFKYLKPWFVEPRPRPRPLDPPPSPPRSSSAGASRRVDWASKVNGVQAGAMDKLRKLIGSRLPCTHEEFKAWFDANFSLIGAAGRLATIRLLFAAYQHFVAVAAAAPADQGEALSQLPPFTPFLQGPSQGLSVVDEVFSQHLRADPKRVRAAVGNDARIARPGPASQPRATR